MLKATECGREGGKGEGADCGKEMTGVRDVGIRCTWGIQIRTKTCRMTSVRHVGKLKPWKGEGGSKRDNWSQGCGQGN